MKAPAAVRGKLKTYRAKRDFTQTKEPSGQEEPAGKGQSFVVQKHRATRLHYDFRLEIGGVLKSWAVPKGPSVDPKVPRLAVEVEDHPLAYGTFEGTIPAGNYGAGAVALWDRGAWSSAEDAPKALKKGRFHFTLHGEKMHGQWLLTRTRSKGGGKPSWFLIKHRDEHAADGDPDRLLDDGPESVASGRSLDEIAQNPEAEWTRGGERKVKPAKAKKPAAAPKRKSGSDRLPAFIEPQLATLVTAPPAGSGWLHEIKFDGYRLMLRVEKGKCRVFTRSGQDWTARFRRLADAAQALPVASALLDGEAVVLDDKGVSDFGRLQDALSRGDDRAIHFYAFDLLHLDGHDVRKQPLTARKELLRAVIEPAGEPLHYSDHMDADSEGFYRHACAMAVEGVVSKRADAPYTSGRGHAWVKSKCLLGEEFVICGFTERSDEKNSIGALLLCVREGDGYRYTGRVGTGFDADKRAMLRGKLQKLVTAKPAAPPSRRADARGATWVKPQLVCEVSFTGWTGERLLRHPVFKGLREDKPAREVAMDRAESPPRAAIRKAAAKPAGKGRADVAGIAISHPERVVYPGDGTTKLRVAEYYAAVADWIMPHVARRPLSVVRCPEGSAGECFFQKHVARGMNPEIIPVEIADSKGRQQYISVDSIGGLISLIQFGCLEIHPWGSTVDDLERPDRMVFDLDPHEDVPLEALRLAALEFRQRLADLGLESFLRTTGGKGLHVVVPLLPRASWDEMHAFAQAVSNAAARDTPSAYTTNMRKVERTGRIFIDFLRNRRGATSIASYATRAKPVPTVAVPLAWSEIRKFAPDAFEITSTEARVKRLKNDPWKELFTVRQSITAKARKALGLKG
jgi:bifunctional non-homologous end joining protein LigD